MTAKNKNMIFLIKISILKVLHIWPSSFMLVLTYEK